MRLENTQLKAQLLQARLCCHMLDAHSDATPLTLLPAAHELTEHEFLLLIVSSADSETPFSLSPSIQSCFQIAVPSVTVHAWFSTTVHSCCLLSCEAGADKDIIYRQMENALEVALLQHGLSLKISCSKWHPGDVACKWFFQEALVANDHSIGSATRINGPETVRVSEHVFAAEDISSYERKLMSLVSQHEFHRAAATFDQIIAVLVRRAHLSLESTAHTVHTRFLQIFGWLGLDSSPESQAPLYSSALRDIFEADSFGILQDRCHDLFAMLDDTINRSYGSKAKEICGFIASHYQDPAMGAQLICDTFLFSKSYLSRLFRNEIGSNISDYIHRVRIKAAIDLIVTTSKPISEICELVGYTNRNTMHRAFCKITGMSPSAYRKANKR